MKQYFYWGDLLFSYYEGDKIPLEEINKLVESINTSFKEKAKTDKDIVSSCNIIATCAGVEVEITIGTGSGSAIYSYNAEYYEGCPQTFDSPAECEYIDGYESFEEFIEDMIRFDTDVWEVEVVDCDYDTNESMLEHINREPPMYID